MNKPRNVALLVCAGLCVLALGVTWCLNVGFFARNRRDAPARVPQKPTSVTPMFAMTSSRPATVIADGTLSPFTRAPNTLGDDVLTREEEQVLRSWWKSKGVPRAEQTLANAAAEAGRICVQRSLTREQVIEAIGNTPTHSTSRTIYYSYAPSHWLAIHFDENGAAAASDVTGLHASRQGECRQLEEQ